MSPGPDEKSFEEIAPDGDVVFSLENGATCVQVSSTVMKLASPVFAAMLGPNFKEGQALVTTPTQPVEILLPDDDLKGFIFICRILHFQRGFERAGSDFDGLTSGPAGGRQIRPGGSHILLRRIVDKKYVSIVQDTVHAAVPSRDYRNANHVIEAQKALDEREDYVLKISDLFFLLLVCYGFQAQDDFQVISQRIMREHTGSFISFATEMEPRTRGLVDTAALYKLAGALQEKRANLLVEISNCLQIDMFHFLIKRLGLEEQSVAQYFESVKAYDGGACVMFGCPETQRLYSLHYVLICIENFRPSNCPSISTTNRKMLLGYLENRVKTFAADMGGLCVFCVHKGYAECIDNHDATSS